MKKIYVLRDRVDGKEYIGQTCRTLSERLSVGYRQGTKIREAIDRDGIENFDKTVLEDGLTDEEANEREQYYIRTRNTVWPNGLNLEGGGRHNSVHSITSEKISQSKKGAPLSEKQLAALENLWETNRSHTQSEESNLKRNKSELNRPDLSKPVQRFTKDGQLIAEYPSACEAQRQTGIFQGNISACCRGKLKSAGGYVWKYTSHD